MALFPVLQVEQLIEKAEREHTGNPRQPDKPLIRLRVGCFFFYLPVIIICTFKNLIATFEFQLALTVNECSETTLHLGLNKT